MIVDELIEDLDEVLKQNSEAGDYQIGFKKSVSDEVITRIGAVHWDEEEFFLVAEGDESKFDLKPMKLSVSEFIKKLNEISENDIHKFAAFMRTRVARTLDGENISINLPINGTVISDKKKAVYFFSEDADDEALEKQVHLISIEATASRKSENIHSDQRYPILSLVYENKAHKAEMLAHYDLFKDGWKDIKTLKKGIADATSASKVDSPLREAYRLAIENGVYRIIYYP